jgi:hypothetical protein
LVTFVRKRTVAKVDSIGFVVRIVSVPARIASSARRLALHLPQRWPWEEAWNTLFDTVFGRNKPIIG